MCLQKGLFCIIYRRQCAEPAHAFRFDVIVCCATLKGALWVEECCKSDHRRKGCLFLPVWTWQLSYHPNTLVCLLVILSVSMDGHLHHSSSSFHTDLHCLKLVGFDYGWKIDWEWRFSLSYFHRGLVRVQGDVNIYEMWFLVSLGAMQFGRVQAYCWKVQKTLRLSPRFQQITLPLSPSLSLYFLSTAFIVAPPQKNHAHLDTHLHTCNCKLSVKTGFCLQLGNA